MRLVVALPRVVALLARHALGYADLATEELAAARALLRRRLLATVVCILATIFAVLMFCSLAIAVAWDTPHRIAVIAALALAFVTAAIISGEVARRMRPRSAQLLPRLRNEWSTDREILREALATPAPGNDGRDDA